MLSYVIFPVPVALTAAIMALLFTEASVGMAALVYVGTGTAITLGVVILRALRSGSESSG